MLVVQALQVWLAENLLHLQAPAGQVADAPKAGPIEAEVLLYPSKLAAIWGLLYVSKRVNAPVLSRPATTTVA